jgi:prepilin-type N-terminal cleavage/methylation domain-containing protein
MFIMPSMRRGYRRQNHCAPRAGLPGFTLVELLVVIAIIVTILAILLPAFAGIRRSSRVAADLSNLRLLQAAQLAYATEFGGFLADARLPHGGAAQGETESFVATLKPYYDSSFALKSPLDQSPHWPTAMNGENLPVPGSGGRYRSTSYGINNFLAREFSPQAAIDPSLMTDRLTKVASPAATVHMLLMTETGEYAGSDHPHVESWGNLAQGPLVAATQVATAAAGGLPKTSDARSDYSFLDGHTASLKFSEVYIDPTVNRFDPSVSGLFDRRIATTNGAPAN